LTPGSASRAAGLPSAVSTNSFEVAGVGTGDTVELEGYDGERLAACRRIEVG
jgi:hypothetical protein